jgi:hypothetical protein
LPIGQTAERLRVSDPTLGEDPAGSDRADLRHHQEDIADPRRPHTGGWVGEDLHQLDLSRSELLFQLRSRRPYLVRLLQRTQTLFARSARNARTGAALRHADDSAARTGRWSTTPQQTMRPPHPTTPTPPGASNASLLIEAAAPAVSPALSPLCEAEPNLRTPHDQPPQSHRRRHYLVNPDQRHRHREDQRRRRHQLDRERNSQSALVVRTRESPARQVQRVLSRTGARAARRPKRADQSARSCGAFRHMVRKPPTEGVGAPGAAATPRAGAPLPHPPSRRPTPLSSGVATHGARSSNRASRAAASSVCANSTLSGPPRLE